MIIFGNDVGPFFKFANDALSTVGVHNTLPGWVNVGRITVTGSLEGPPVQWPDPSCGEACIPGDPNDPVGGIPEPGTWALMILGFGAAGAALRRRKLAYT
jgi:hypothetical protein